LTNILIHILAAIAVYLFLKQLFKSKVSLLITLIFLIHPIQTEAVSYVSGLSDPLVALFGFLTLYTFVGYTKDRLPILSIGLCLLALLSKESGVIFSGVILVLWILNKKINLRSFLVNIVPFFLLTLIYLWYHWNIIQVVDMKTVWGDHPYTHSVLVRIATFLSFFPTYIEILLFPLHLFYDRDFSIQILRTIWSFPAFWSATTIFSLLSVVLIDNYRKRNFLSLCLLLCFFIALSPFMGFILINGIIYEHYLYIPLIFFFAFLATYIKEIKRFVPVLGIILVLFIARSWVRQYQWADPVRLYTHSLEYVPNSFRVRNNLASEYQRRQQYELAIAEYRKAIELNPRVPNPYHNLGNLYLTIGKTEQAKQYFQKALEVDPNFFYSTQKLEQL
jgi:hypothetical protein